ncbi:MAG TPA: hypothetical protein VGJ73_02785, partial [Verrucomicrobiae bacterium]
MDAKENANAPETNVLLIQDASVAKMKYATSATPAIKTMNPYGMIGCYPTKVKQRCRRKVATALQNR